MKIPFPLYLVVLALVLASMSNSLDGAPVTGTWVNAVGQGNGPITDANTAAPVVGDGSTNSAAGEMFHSPFAPITLSNSGEKIVFTGKVLLVGTVNSLATSSVPRTQFRFGMFKDEGGGDDLGWVGYYMSNKHGNTGTPSGVLARKPVGNTSVYLSVNGQNALVSVQGDGTAASLFHDSLYSMTMTIERSGADLLVSAILTSTNGFTQTLSATDTTASTLSTYTFDRVGFLLGANIAADHAFFSDLDVSFISSTPSLTIARNGDNTEVTWPESAIGHTLETISALVSAGTWTPVEGSASTNRVIQATSGDALFFRLRN